MLGKVGRNGFNTVGFVIEKVQLKGRKMIKKALSTTIIVAFTLLNGCTENAGGFYDENFGSVGANGITQSVKVDARTLREFQISVGDRVFFDVDQSVLSSEAMATLDSQGKWLAENMDYLVVIEGHADEQGTREYNLALGARRANAVKEYLVSLGIVGSRLKTVTYGKERPIEICSLERCYKKNRRAVSVLDNLSF